MARKTSVILYRPDGGTVRQYEDVTDVETREHGTHVQFTKRSENVADKTATVTTITSNLKFMIVEEVTGSAGLI
jgi:hypothetical protein